MSDVAARVPPLDAALVLISVRNQVERTARGSIWCKDAGIGAQRRLLGKPSAYGSGEIMFTEMDLARDRAQALLAEVCTACPFRRCSMKRW